MTCSECGTTLISSLTYPYQGETLTSHYCTTCDCWQPEPKGSWSKWKPQPEDFYGEQETPKQRRERQLLGRWRGQI